MTAVRLLATTDTARHAAVEGGSPIELTVAFTDLENFTTYTEAEGDEAASRLLIDHHRQSDAIVRSHGGRVLKRLGDGLMLTFSEPEAAVLACLELGDAAPLRLRAGIHGGHVLVTGDDVIGHVVNLAARVTGSAAGGELVTTNHTRAAVGDLRGVVFDGPYTRSFKGIEEKVQVYFASRHDHRFADPPTDQAARRDLLVNDDGAHGR
jgi:adenylate cyclase